MERSPCTPYFHEPTWNDFATLASYFVEKKRIFILEKYPIVVCTVVRVMHLLVEYRYAGLYLDLIAVVLGFCLTVSDHIVCISLG